MGVVRGLEEGAGEGDHGGVFVRKREREREREREKESEMFHNLFEI